MVPVKVILMIMITANGYDHDTLLQVQWFRLKLKKRVDWE